MSNPTYDLADLARTGGPQFDGEPTGKFKRPGQYVQTHRVRAVVAGWLHRFEIENAAVRSACGPRSDYSESVGSAGSRDVLAARAGVSTKMLSRILSGRHDSEGGSRWLSIDTVDRLFCAMDCVGLFHRHPTNEIRSDGFADVYFHPAIVGDDVAAEAAVVVDLPGAWDECDDDPTYSSKLRTWAA